jgi:hypothetical protein
MPVADVKAVLAASDVRARDKLIRAHLTRMEAQLRQTAATVSALRELLAPAGPPPDIELRTDREVRAWAVTAEVDLDGIKDWFSATLAQIRGQLASAGTRAAGPAGGLFARELFTDGQGETTCTSLPRARPRRAGCARRSSRARTSPW